MRKIIRQIELLQHQQISIELHWIPAHKKLEGNEAADRAAKSATGWRLKHKRNGRTIELDTGITAAKANNVPIQKVPVHTTLARLAASDWATNWSHDNHGKELRNIAPRPSRAILKLHTKLSKGLSSLLIQMRTGIIHVSSLRRTYSCVVLALHSFTRRTHSPCFQHSTVITHPPIIRCCRPVGQQVGVLGQQVNLLANGLDLVNRSTHWPMG